MTESTGQTDPLLVCAPLRFEARAVRRGLRDSARAAGRGPAGRGRRAARRGAPEVLRVGYGPARAAARAAELESGTFATMAVMGTGAGLAPDLNPGDLVVGTEVAMVRDGQPDPATVVRVPSAPLLLGELRRAGPPAHARPVGAGESPLTGAPPLPPASRGARLAVTRAVPDPRGPPLLNPGLSVAAWPRCARCGRPARCWT